MNADSRHPQRHKLREFARAAARLRAGPLPAEVELPPEDGDSFAANALVKARAARAATGAAGVADDSGIEAAALDGAPGVRSARYAGEEPPTSRTSTSCSRGRRRRERPPAPPTSARSPIEPTAREHVFEARCDGQLWSSSRAASGGFGYDPAFVPDDTGPDDERRWPSSSPAEKNAISHRGRAARAARRHLDVGPALAPRAA